MAVLDIIVGVLVLYLAILNVHTASVASSPGDGVVKRSENIDRELDDVLLEVVSALLLDAKSRTVANNNFLQDHNLGASSIDGQKQKKKLTPNLDRSDIEQRLLEKKMPPKLMHNILKELDSSKRGLKNFSERGKINLERGWGNPGGFPTK